MNRRVVVIGKNSEYRSRNTPFPPIGTLGTTVSEIDEDGDYDVMFDNFPCPVSMPDESWCTHHSLIVFIDEDYSIETLLHAENPEGEKWI